MDTTAFLVITIMVCVGLLISLCLLYSRHKSSSGDLEAAQQQRESWDSQRESWDSQRESWDRGEGWDSLRDSQRESWDSQSYCFRW